MITEHEIEQLEKIFPQGVLVVVPDKEDRQHLRLALMKGNDNPTLIGLLVMIKTIIDEMRKADNGKD